MKSGKKKVNKIHVPTKVYHNDGDTIGLEFSEDFGTLTLLIRGEKVEKITLTKAQTQTLAGVLEEGLI